MRLASFFPDDPILDLFTKYSENEYIENGDEQCEAIACMSVTQWKRIPRGTGLPLVVHCWDLATNWRSWCRTEQDYALNVHRDSEIANQLHLMAEADLVIACSEHTQTVLKTMGIKSTVLHNFYYGEELDRMTQDRKIEKKNQIIQVSRFALNKRFDLTMKMWIRIQKKYPKWNLLLAGFGGECEKELRGMAVPGVTIETGLDRYTLVGKMAESKILVAPSLNEGFGLSPLEARHLGLDTVCANEPWVNEFGYATKVFETDNLEEYVQAVEDSIERPFDTPQRWSDLTPQKYAERFDKLIKEVL